jgi:Cytidylate kinase-like family
MHTSPQSGNSLSSLGDDPSSGEELAVPAPRHGYQGDRGVSSAPPEIPAHLTITLSRESGARGGTIGRRVAQRLGWAVYDQDLLEYMAQDGVVRQGVLDQLSPEAAAWAEARLQQLLRQEQFSSKPPFLNLLRVVLALGAQGKAVLIGRGSGHILPPESTLHARIVAPLPARIAYMSQWLRLSEEEAAERVRTRDERRKEFIQTHFQVQPEDVHQYDLLLNSSLLGEVLCVELLAQAAQAVAEVGLPKGRLVTE